MRDICATADLLLDLGACEPIAPVAPGYPVRVLVDTDPVFTQVRHLTDRAARASRPAHGLFTFGENITTDVYHPERRLAVEADAPADRPRCLAGDVRGQRDGAFTTVMQWDSYAAVEHGAVRYGMKSGSFKPFIDLPANRPVPLELAIGGSAHRGPTHQQRLEAEGSVRRGRRSLDLPAVYSGIEG